VASKHRQDSFNACNFVMDWLKTQAPFWKIEDDGNKKKWVEFNSLDNEAVKKWKV
ncbi:MAG: molybdopterin synthase catalytic subunit, partial [Alphaproteobacteria bacterium]|nr:molybdopterin synthase catalytic subunit [Alphaproteobacteria bacterium]